MRVFKIKKGGAVENAEECLLVLNREIDKDLLMSAVNNVAERYGDETVANDVLEYLDKQFKATDLVDFDDLETFYY